MKRHVVEELLPKADWSIYRLVRMAAVRALELSDGKKCLVKDIDTDKFTSQALEEIAQGKVVSKLSKQELSEVPAVISDEEEE